MYYFTSLVRTHPPAANRLASEAPTLLACARDRVYVRRTTDPHRRATNWKTEATKYLGRTLHRLANLGYICYKDYIPICRVWFCLVGAKSTRELTWGAPVYAFKMMVARTPNKLNSQALEHCKLKRGVIRNHETLHWGGGQAPSSRLHRT
jgi:hypothetical protein